MVQDAFSSLTDSAKQELSQFRLGRSAVSNTYLAALRLRHFSPEEHAAGRVSNSHRSLKGCALNESKEEYCTSRLLLLSWLILLIHTEQCSVCTKLLGVPGAMLPLLLRALMDPMAEKFAARWFVFLESFRGVGVMGSAEKRASRLHHLVPWWPARSRQRSEEEKIKQIVREHNVSAPV